MGDKVKRMRIHFIAAIISVCAALMPFAADAAPASAEEETAPAAGSELWVTSDSDHTDVVKLLGRALWDFEGRDKYQGIAVERAWFRPQGQHSRKQIRVYVDFADHLGEDWWQARVGTNGHTILGSGSLRTSDWSKELFVEREVVETPRGLDHGIYYTFAGGSMDLRVGPKDLFNVMAGTQEFTGRNVRLQLRGSYIHVLKPELGLSIQLRSRYFHSTVPNEFDYFSPRNFMQIVPVLQLRRFSSNGWMYLAAIGYGAQKASANSWQAARLADLRLESPIHSRKFQAFAQVQYSNNSLTAGTGAYYFVLGRLGLTMRLR